MRREGVGCNTDERLLETTSWRPWKVRLRTVDFILQAKVCESGFVHNFQGIYNTPYVFVHNFQGVNKTPYVFLWLCFFFFFFLGREPSVFIRFSGESITQNNWEHTFDKVSAQLTEASLFLGVRCRGVGGDL